jgi:hypothetical protein
MVEAKVNLELAVIVEMMVADFARIYLDVTTRVSVGVVHLTSFLKNVFFRLQPTLRLLVCVCHRQAFLRYSCG